MTRIITWNIRQGGGSKLPEIVEALARHDADIVVLTEYQGSSHNVLERFFEDKGYVYADTNPEERQNGLLVACRHPFELIADTEDAEDRQRWMAIRIPQLELQVLAVHIPGSDDHKFVQGSGVSGSYRKKQFWERLNAHASAHVGDNLLIAGDFNTGLKIDAEGVPFKLSSCMRELINFGYQDAWRATHGEAREYTWYSQTKIDGVTQDKNGFRLDYVFASPTMALRLLDCKHSHVERTARISDHSMLIADFS